PPGTKIAGPGPRAHAENRLTSLRAKGLFDNWEQLFATPFRVCITVGSALRRLFTLKPEGSSRSALIDAVSAVLAQMTAEQKAAACFPADSDLWRHWQNTELYVEHYGLRLEDVGEPMRDAIMAVLRASMSQRGFELSRDSMRLN